jgi:shikimate kinase
MGGSTTRNVGLIGFMGTGKTTIGKALARSTHRQFFDTDTLVEEIAGKTISQIFLTEGEESFRILESKVVKEVCENESAVISFGGGVVLSTSNIKVIRTSSVVVLLRAKVETILMRTASNHYRPLLNNTENDVEKRIRSMLRQRRTFYETAMDYALDTDALGIDEAVTKIIQGLKL